MLMCLVLCVAPVIASDAGSIVEGSASSVEDLESDADNESQNHSDDTAQERESDSVSVSSLSDDQFTSITDRIDTIGLLLIAGIGTALGYKSGHDLLYGLWR